MTKTYGKSRLPSRHVTEGPERAPHRSYLYAMGVTETGIHAPLVGVATTWNEAAPCNISLGRQAQAGVWSTLDANRDRDVVAADVWRVVAARV